MVDQLKIDLEAKRIYSAIFHNEIPSLLAERFSTVVQSLNMTLNRDELESYYALIDQSIDLEAKEVSFRIRGEKGVLSQRFHIMIYLAETLPDHQKYFVNEKSSFVVGAINLAWCLIWTAYKLLFGLVSSSKS